MKDERLEKAQKLQKSMPAILKRAIAKANKQFEAINEEC